MDKKYWKKWQSNTYTATGQVFEGEGYVSTVSIVSDGAGATTATLYDGHSTNGVVKLPMRALINAARPYNFDPPMVIKQGLYLSTGSNLGGVTIQFMECAKR